MARNARIEDISDDDSDPAEMDVSDLANSAHVLAPVDLPPPTSSASSSSAAGIPFRGTPPGYHAVTNFEQSKRWHCLYPLYFDSGRTRAEGRRVGKELAVANPLARELVDAAQNLGLRVVLEPEATHPKDWSNPGRLRVLLKQDGMPVSRTVKNKHHLYILISQYLKEHPTTDETPLRLPIPGMPEPKLPIPPSPVPRGWKLNNILPLHSAAMSGGGVSENAFKDMMAEQLGLIDGTAAASGDDKKKKDKKKKGK